MGSNPTPSARDECPAHFQPHTDAKAGLLAVRSRDLHHQMCRRQVSYDRLQVGMTYVPSNLNFLFRLSLKFYGLRSLSVARGLIPERSEASRRPCVFKASPKSSDGTGREPAVAEMSRPVTARAALSIGGLPWSGRAALQSDRTTHLAKLSLQVGNLFARRAVTEFFPASTDSERFDNHLRRCRDRR